MSITKITPYKIASVKKVFEGFNLMSIPEMEENDIDQLISLIIVGTASNPEDFNNMMNIITDEKRDWSNEDITECRAVIKDFFVHIPSECKTLIKQLSSARNTLSNVVTQMMENISENMNLKSTENPTE